jgi:hypothetical protein
MSNVLDGTRKPLGQVQTADLSSAVGVGTIPANAKVALIQAQDNDVSWRDDGTAASASIGGTFGGMVLAAGDTILYTGDLNALSFFEAVADATAYVNISFYK